MNTIKILCGITMSVLLAVNIHAQTVTQVVRGKVVDAESQMPLAYASVAIIGINPPMGTTTNENGEFRLEKVPVGRYNIQFSFLGYESKVIPELMVTSGKEVILKVGLKESITKLDEVIVKAYTNKDKPLNSMATLSARTFSVEEAQRYAGGFDDPARLASSFAGVSTGYLDDNGIIVRGNAPKGLLWRLEGVEIPNPNHFAGMSTFGGGGISALSSLMLSNSDFFTGAFPAEYGNALSGVFDIKLKTGNNEKHEHAVQLGALGLDISSEGPFSKNSKASYIFNYRYSTFGIIKPVLPEEANVPIYQDLCFKLNFPTEKAGTFSLWGLATDDKIAFEADADTSLWSYLEDQEVGDATQRMGVAGINHRYILGKKSFINTSLVASGDYTQYNGGYMDFDYTKYATEYIDKTNYKFLLSSSVNHKFSAKHTNRTGIIVSQKHYNTTLKYAPQIGDALITAVDEEDVSHLFQFYTQSKYNLSEKLMFNMGLHTQYFDLNEEFILEPRLGATYNFNNIHALSVAYGKHSRTEPQTLYFAQVMSPTGLGQPNRDLGLTKAHHFVLAYDVSLTANMRLKIEPFAQFLYDVPVTPDSSYSTINMTADWYFSDALSSDGTGTNFGIDFTLERFLNDGYYYLLTASLFESKYVGGDNVERMSRYNSNYVVNLLFGKEWTFGDNNNKILGVNGRLNILGGQRLTPVNYELSNQYHEVIYDYDRAFEDQKPPVYHLNASITWRKNKENYSGIWSLQVLNAMGTPEFYGNRYNYRTNTVEEDKIRVVVPSIAYKIEF